MSDYLRRAFRTFSKLFITDTEQLQNVSERIQPRTPPKCFTPLRPTSRVSRRVPHSSRRFSTPARRDCPIIQCPSQISLKKFNSDSDLSLKNEKSGNIRMRRASLDRHFVAENEGTIPMRNNGSEISQPPSYKSSNSSFDYFSMAGDVFDPSESCHKMFPIRRQFGKNKHILHPGCLHACDNPKSCSKIPVLDQNRRNQRGLHTLTTQQTRTMDDVDRSQQAGGDNSVRITSSDIGNWVEFRNDTTSRFERVFKILSRKKFPIGNLMDSSSHARWMQLSGIGVERDAQIFKLFAGGKVVLNIGEYKFLLEKICKTYELDYWDVLRKMAMTYEYEDPQH